MSLTEEQIKKAYDALAQKIPEDKMMVVPIFLFMINPRTWKFSNKFGSPELQEVADTIENCQELRSIFSTTGCN